MTGFPRSYTDELVKLAEIARDTRKKLVQEHDKFKQGLEVAIAAEIRLNEAAKATVNGRGDYNNRRKDYRTVPGNPQGYYNPVFPGGHYI